MRVPRRCVAVRVRVRLAGWVIGAVFVLVVFVVNVRVFVGHFLVIVFVVVPLGQVQPHAQPHQHALKALAVRASSRTLSSARSAGVSDRIVSNISFW